MIFVTIIMGVRPIAMVNDTYGCVFCSLAIFIEKSNMGAFVTHVMLSGANIYTPTTYHFRQVVHRANPCRQRERMFVCRRDFDTLLMLLRKVGWMRVDERP